MRTVHVDGSFEGWRDAARALLAQGVPPADVAFSDAGQLGLLPSAASGAIDHARAAGAVRVPPAFVTLARDVACHRDPSRFDRLYRLLWRAARERRDVLEDPADPDVLALGRMADAVRKDVHRTHALVRFRRVAGDGGERFVAFHRPDHRTLARAAPFFVRRFATMRWSILTPDASAHWDGQALHFGGGIARDVAAGDDVEALWRAYYASTFNPARVNPRLLRAHLPARHWETLPEGREIAALVRSAAPRVAAMTAPPPSASAARVPPSATIAELAAAARGCDACGVCPAASQTVFGRGPPDARLVVVGEQPGDEEDRAGVPFVGPAGAVLDAALADSGVDRGALYVTNAVKGFKHELRGKRRIHQRPDASEVRACAGWLEAELRAIRPAVVVALGATAAHALLGARFPLSRERGRVHVHPLAPAVLATWHPAAILRAADASLAERMRAELAGDLARAAALAAGARTS
ncbi:MAG TPA: UdgX family uracil-DNA binding protein [Anaeromyxobacter sp.]|nr:UdgX family uracil-DNA binding protein [Anaeromyxobacter sp.]